jgi:hypothetical protein
MQIKYLITYILENNLHTMKKNILKYKKTKLIILIF